VREFFPGRDHLLPVSIVAGWFRQRRKIGIGFRAGARTGLGFPDVPFCRGECTVRRRSRCGRDVWRGHIGGPPVGGVERTLLPWARRLGSGGCRTSRWLERGGRRLAAAHGGAAWTIRRTCPRGRSVQGLLRDTMTTPRIVAVVLIGNDVDGVSVHSRCRQPRPVAVRRASGVVLRVVNVNSRKRREGLERRVRHEPTRGICRPSGVLLCLIGGRSRRRSSSASSDATMGAMLR